VKSVIEADGVLGELLVQTMFRRRQALLLLRSGLQLIGSRYCPDTQRLREFAARNRLAYSWIDLDSDPVGPALLRTLRLEVRDTPVALLGGGSVLVNPSNAEFATAAGIAAWARAQAQHRVTMLDALRGRRGLTGTKKDCDQDACGAWPEPESVNGVVS
jgi:thioredoxin reductase (NADPH)